MIRDLTVDQKVRPPQAHRARVTDGGRTVLSIPKVQKFLEHIVLGEKLSDAAQAAGVNVRRARRLMADPAVRKEYLRQCDLLTEGERARNHLLLTTIRDRGLQDGASAAQQKVSTEAARILAGRGDEVSGGVTINGGQNVIAGYVIDLRGEVEGPRVIRPQVSRDAVDI
ncbi:hypothetical protein FQV39_03375 [Bosea sp. F3-2]|uniref:hypothetical protein n=1 Tax=Bosea sp. F3-2 TaxID=2599640 RepID=UPI0011EC0000|nr:hypothetical protein [Bosea sp. F3-2]QEL21723.1 hypothetical protein FQV39_03375 [Bosea sp. F3-2]